MLRTQQLADTQRVLQNIQEAIQLLSRLPKGSRDIEDQSSGIRRVVHKDANLSVMAAFNRTKEQLDRVLQENGPARLEAMYAEWKETRQLEVMYGLIQIVDMLDRPKPIGRPTFAGQGGDQLIVQGFGGTVAQLLNLNVEAIPGQGSAQSALASLKPTVWKLRFIEPAGDARAKIATGESNIRTLETLLAQEQEIESIKTSLRGSIASGKTDANLEQRIAALPPDRRNEVEAFRKQEQDAKEQQLAKALEEQQTQERVLQRQRLVDEAINLRIQEIETGKPNPTAEAQRRANPELKRAVERWETAYRQDQAEKKAEEARRKLAEAEQAKAEAEQRRRAEAIARQQQEEKASREAILRQYDVRATILGHQLQANPFRFQGQAVILTGVRFQRMVEKQVGIFLTLQNHEIMVSGLPVEMFSIPGQSMPMIVRVRGVAPVTNRMGAMFEIPHVEYLATP